MITINKPLGLSHAYPLERIGKPEEILFFDIETTGFSGEYSRLYLIGCIYFREGRWNLVQWFADTPESETELLHSFFSFLKGFRILVHFNGDGFDLPYLRKRCAHYSLPWDFSGIKSMDIYRRVKPYRKLLGLENVKQKAIEQFLGIFREDALSGGELIPVYQEYLLTHDTRLYHLLILHNEDDLKGMPSILPILSYPDFLESPFRLVRQDIRREKEEKGIPVELLGLTCESDCRIPIPFSAQKTPVRCHAENSRLFLGIQLFHGTLKHFYPNYKDYYYLPYEDTAIHKSVGEYVDKAARVRATAKTCYTKQEGCFIPQPEPVWEPYLKKDWKDTLTYADFSRISLQDPEIFRRYVALLLKYLMAKER